MIQQTAPTLDEISPSIWAEVWIDDQLQYSISDKIQMLNLRLWAKANKAEHRILFIWSGGEVRIENNRLKGATQGFFEADTLLVKSLLFNDNPTHYFT